MLYNAKKGQASYGEAIGILLLDTSFAPYIPGDVANATTYQFPVRFKVVKDMTPETMFSKKSKIQENIIESAQELVNNGVRAITSDCGFTIIFQERVSKEFEVPVFLSSLLQLPFLSKIIGYGKKIGIITARSYLLTDDVLRKSGLDDLSILSIKGLEDKDNFRKAISEQKGFLDFKKVELEVVSTAIELVEKEPEIALILLECSCLAPYSLKVQQAVNLPVFDFITMINYVYSAVVQKTYKGFM